MTLITTNSDNLTTLKTSKTHSFIVSNRLILGISAFSVSFGLSLVPNWDFNKAFITGLITVLATYCAALFVDKRRRNYEMLILSSLRKRIRELEGLKYRIVREIKQIEEHRSILYTESQHLQNQIAESRNQRDSLNREISSSAGQKKQLESDINNFKAELNHLENNTAELNHTCADLAAEKRRLEINCNVSRSEITQLQTQIEAFSQEKQEIESNLTLLNRLKPQLEEKLHELRTEIQALENNIATENNLLTDTTTARKIAENHLTNLQTQNQTQQVEINQLQNQITLLQDERDLLQNQVWELLQNMEILNQETLTENIHEDETELFPFDELLEPVDSQAKTANLPPEWSNFLENLPNYEIQVLKAIVEEDNPKAIIKQIAEEHITMPNLLIDSINEIANNTLGELIIETGEEIPEIYQEHISNVRKIIAMYEQVITNSTSLN